MFLLWELLTVAVREKLLLDEMFSIMRSTSMFSGKSVNRCRSYGSLFAIFLSVQIFYFDGLILENEKRLLVIQKLFRILKDTCVQMFMNMYSSLLKL